MGRAALSRLCCSPPSSPTSSRIPAPSLSPRALAAGRDLLDGCAAVTAGAADAAPRILEGCATAGRNVSDAGQGLMAAIEWTLPRGKGGGRGRRRRRGEKGGEEEGGEEGVEGGGGGDPPPAVPV